MQWSQRAATRAASINTLMWSKSSCCWTDLLLQGQRNTTENQAYQCSQLYNVHACSWLPFLWGLPGPEICTVDIVKAMHQSGLVRDGGLATTLVSSNQQWDASSSWAPLVCMWVDGLCQHGGSDGRRLGESLGRTFLTAVNVGLSQTGCVWEKYNSSICGDCGHGGEYQVQRGFGWTNGTVLHFLLNIGLTVTR